MTLPLIPFVTLTVSFLLPQHTQALAADLSNLTYNGFQDSDIDMDDVEAKDGLRSIFEGDDFHYGLPYKLYQSVGRQQTLDAEKRWFLFGSLPSPPFRQSAGRSVSLGEAVFARQGDFFVNGNCFSCHAGVVAGTVYSGVGNTHLDTAAIKEFSNQLTRRSDTFFGRLGLLVLLNEHERDVLKKYQDYLRTILLPAVDAKARGENHGPFVIWRMIARMIDPEQSLAIYPPNERAPMEYLIDRPLPPVDPNPWWHFKYKKRAFWTQDVSHDSYATFALNLMDPHPTNTETFPERMERMRKQLAYVNQIVTPAFPDRNQINRDLAFRGMELFHGREVLANGNTLPCSSCHGTYDDEGEVILFPELPAIDWRIVGTDPAYASILHNEFKPLYERFQRSNFAPHGEDIVHYPEIVGYAPPPLKGIWASAPYFHNGSVPTVYHVLKSTERPQFWRKSLDPRDYNRQRLGLIFSTLSENDYDLLKRKAERSNDKLSEDWINLRQIYSTQEFGRTNMGHTFGDQMTDEERNAVIEYLKLL